MRAMIDAAYAAASDDEGNVAGRKARDDLGLPQAQASRGNQPHSRLVVHVSVRQQHVRALATYRLRASSAP